MIYTRFNQPYFPPYIRGCVRMYMITNRDIRALNNTLTDIVDLLDSLLDTQECILFHMCDCQEEE